METYELKASDGCFDDFYSLLVAIASLATAAQWHTSGTVDFKPGETIALECNHLSDREVHLPLFGPVESALAGVPPKIIQISVKQRNPAPPGYTTQTSGFARAVETIFQPFFVNFYERYSDEIAAKYGVIDKEAPSAWQMGWVVRNAVSHNGCVGFKNKNHLPVTWQGLTLSPADEGKALFHSTFSAGDLIVMMFEMEEVRTGKTIDKAI
ncbi:MAG: hypothetical protein RL651_304 [Pseudomonadota bacterium]|jgi:hypothetical protein